MAPGWPTDRPLAAIVLAGGRGSRLGGADKAAVELDGQALLDRALAPLRHLPHVVVGPPRTGVLTVQEDPPGSGPAAGLAAGLAALPDPGGEGWVLVLACDLVHPDQAVATLLETPPDEHDDGVVLTDVDHRPQWLTGCYRRAALERALEAAGDPTGLSMRELLSPLRLRHLPADQTTTADIDTWADHTRWSTTKETT